MAKLTLDCFNKGISLLEEVFRDGKSISSSLKEIYWNCLKEFTEEQFKAAIESIISTHVYNFMPKPADIISAINGSSIDDAAIRAWGYVKKAIAEIGAYESVKFDDEAINYIIPIYFGGWIEICATENDKLVWVEKDFIKYYKSISKCGFKKIDHLPGICEHTNKLNNASLKGKEYLKLPVLVDTKEQIQKLINEKKQDIVNLATNKD